MQTVFERGLRRMFSAIAQKPEAVMCERCFVTLSFETHTFDPNMKCNSCQNTRVTPIPWCELVGTL